MWQLFLVSDEYSTSCPLQARALAAGRAFQVVDYSSVLVSGHRAYYAVTRRQEHWAQQDCQREIQRINGAQPQAGLRQVSSSLASPEGVSPLYGWRRWVAYGLQHFGSCLHRATGCSGRLRQWSSALRSLLGPRKCGRNAKGYSNWITMVMPCSKSISITPS